MADKKRDNIEIDKQHEMRSKGISKMISEGGLGADKYYKIKKHPEEEEKESKENK